VFSLVTACPIRGDTAWLRSPVRVTVHRSCIVALALALFASPGLPRPATAETLDEALALAYETNPRLEAQRARLRATDEGVPQALAGWRPTFNATGSVGQAKQRQSTRVRTQDGNLDIREDALLEPNTVVGEITQPLFRGGQTLAQTRAAENSVRAERARLVSTEQEVFLNVATAYMTVFSSETELELTVRNEQRLQRQLEATRDRFQVGEVTRTDVFQAEARLAQANAERVQAEGRLEAARAAYRNAVGQSPAKLVRPPVPDGLPPDLDAAIDMAIAGNPDVRASAYDERSALDSVDSVRGRLLPTIEVVGRVGREYETFEEEGELTTYEALLRMQVPLYTAGTTHSQLRAAKQTVTQRRRQLDDTQRVTVREATDAWTNLQTARAAILSRSKQVEANQVALEGVQREAEVGARTVLDILNAEQELLNSQVDLVRAERDEVIAAYQLKTAIGDLTAQKLRLDVPFYDPTQHYDEVRGAWFSTGSTGDNSGDFDRQRTAPTR
jgi:type I secretion outer membrane protein, TolC family